MRHVSLSALSAGSADMPRRAADGALRGAGERYRRMAALRRRQPARAAYTLLCLCCCCAAFPQAAALRPRGTRAALLQPSAGALRRTGWAPDAAQLPLRRAWLAGRVDATTAARPLLGLWWMTCLWILCLRARTALRRGRLYLHSLRQRLDDRHEQARCCCLALFARGVEG